MGKKVHIIPHFHWDREWYFNTSRSKVYLLKNLSDVMTVLENKPDFRYFIVDAQASLLEDYLQWKPQDRKRIKNLVEAGKLIIGPWYTQTDLLLISGESIVRNLLYGISYCKKLGGYMNIGYVPDSFGQAAQMPQIYKDFGMDDTVFWRGVSDDEVQKTDFLWRGDDGTVINAYQLPYGYNIGGNIPEQDDELEKYLQTNIIERIGKRASTDQLYYPNGFDQAPVRTNLPELIQKANKLDKKNFYEISSIENYVKAVKKESPRLEEIHGELVNGKLMRIHKSIFSSRPDIKTLNTQVQNYVVNILEPILSISNSLGNEYPQGAVDSIWKLLFENAAHDSIGSCVSDSTNEDVCMRYKQAKDIAENLTEIHSRMIAVRIKNEREKTPITLTLFNTVPYKRSGLVRAEIYITETPFSLKDAAGNSLPYTILGKKDMTDYVLAQIIRLNPSKKCYMPHRVYLAEILLEADSLPAMGYKQIYMELGKNSEAVLNNNSNKVITNKHYEIKINNNGSLDIFDKKSSRLYKQQAVIEENGDDGDSFNYSPPYEDMIISSLNVKAACKCRHSDIYDEAYIEYSMLVPADLRERAQKKCTVIMPVKMKVKLSRNSRVIDFSLEIENKAESHRLIVKFATGIAAQFSIADQQFGLIQRPVKRPELSLWEKHKDEWNEMPLTIEPMQSFAALSNESHTCGIIPKGVREYQIVGNDFDTIALTLFRSYGYMGRENLLYRPGRASGEKIIATPAAQLKGRRKFNFSYYIYPGNINMSDMAAVAKEVLSPIQVYEYADFLNGRLIFVQEDTITDLPDSYSLLELKGKGVVMSALKKAQNSNKVILRYYNGLLNEIAVPELNGLTNFHTARLLHLDESTNGNVFIELDCNSKDLPKIRHCKFATIGLE
ncbi:mannosylglycerate hydrolase [Pectinatus sottacetonis]|uniref:mannosylglycerate hydrolase n=1 Tax=Pectinatus sottacetonis TaxID=1002795 RepID=UPI0018C552F6|nr:mannosylglycerate hydrolase [Pectinatus sottacetonis]